MMCHVMESVQKKPFAVSFCSLTIFSLTSSYFLRGFPAFFIYEEQLAARASKQDMTWKTAQDTHDFNFFGEMGHQKKLSD